jgi:hypothetical protein
MNKVEEKRNKMKDKTGKEDEVGVKEEREY